MKLEYPMRLQAYLAKSGCGSRRSCETLITSGRVKVNTHVVTELGTKVNKDDAVLLDDQPVEPSEQSYYFALNKPKGYVCANYDPFNKLYARDLIDIPDRSLLFHVGRLDKDSIGLILFTNDGQLANAVMHPSHEIEKEYIVQTDRPVDKRDLAEMHRGVYLEDSRSPYKIKSYSQVFSRVIRVVLTEGKNREIRKLFDYFGYEVKQLQRIRIGQIELGELKLGQYRRLEQWEVQSLYKEVSGESRD